MWYNSSEKLPILSQRLAIQKCDMEVTCPFVELKKIVYPLFREDAVTESIHDNCRPVPEEAPVRFFYNGREAVTLLCTPRELKELAVGWLFTERFICGAGEITALGVCEDMSTVTVQASPDRWEESSRLRRAFTSGCGGGNTALSQPDDVLARVCNGPGPDCSLIKVMLAGAIQYKRTGGIHCAALADGKRILFQSEDIGRHNAVDKVIGRGLLEGMLFANTHLLTTGRVSSDMVVKAVRAGIPAVISLSVPTSLAVEIASRAGLLLIGRAARSEPIFYTKI